ncbi:MAG: DUF502 domain-containing protein [Candidatus Omnitrophota bacterium]
MLNIRRYFLSGLAVTLPVLITIYILVILFKITDGLLNPLIKQIFGINIPGLGIIVSLLIIFLVGFFTSHFLNKKILQALEMWFLKFPFVRKIYPSMKQVIKIIFSESKVSFKNVVLVQYPSKDIWSIGLITNEALLEAKKKTGQDLISIFIPSTPSPLTGFFIMMPKQSLIYLDISIEEAMKLVISGGVLLPEK